MADSSSDEEICDDLSSSLDPEVADDTKKRLAYFHACNPTPSQIDRYELFHKFSFVPKASDLKAREEKFMRLINGMIGSKVGSDQIKLLLSTTAKLYVARLVETSLEVAAPQDYSGPLLPEHVQEAKRRMTKRKGSILD